MSLLIFLVGLGVVLFASVALAFISFGGAPSAEQVRLAELARIDREDSHFGVRDVVVFITNLLSPLLSLLRLRGDDDLAFQLQTAGYREPEDLQTFLSAKLLCPILGVLIATFAGRENMLVYAMVLAALGYFAPNLWLIRATGRRKKAIALSLPNALDLLVICMEAGLGMDQSILRVAQELKSTSPELSEELLMLAREQRAGKPRVEAWRSMSERVDVDTINQFVGMLAQSERLGTPIARSLAQFADSLRAKRFMEAEERAAKTTVKLIFPLVMFIFPAMFVVLLGPAALALMEAFDQMSR